MKQQCFHAPWWGQKEMEGLFVSEVNTEDYIKLNAMLNLWGEDKKLQLDKDKLAAKNYFLQNVNRNTVFFHTLQEKLDYLVENDYYDGKILSLYSYEEIKQVFQSVYDFHHRFQSFVSALKFYNQYALKTFDNQRFLERYEDRIAMVALTFGSGDIDKAMDIAHEIINNRYQPATPTFLNAGKAQRGEFSSCFLLTVPDNMEAIARCITDSLQLSKRGGGVALNLTDLREQGAPIKNVEDQASGVIPVMKMLEDAFKYANQLGARQGAGAVYLHAHHPDILRFLDTKRENADEATRIKTLSIGVTMPDITFELAKKNEDMYLFSPYDVLKFYGKPLSEIDVTNNYHDMVNNSKIRKKKINARELFTTIAELNFEAGYPYLLFIDSANKANPIDGHIKMSNLCSEILQVQSTSTYQSNGYHEKLGDDITCNLGSMNIAKAMEGGDLAHTVDVAMRMLTTVSEDLDISAVPSIDQRNKRTHAVGLGQMNLHGFLGRERIMYGSPEAIDFVSCYMAAVNYYTLVSSCNLAQEKGSSFDGFEKSTYADGSYFDLYLEKDFEPEHKKIVDVFTKYGIDLPTQQDWIELKKNVMKYGLYNQYRQAVAPTGSISYVNNATSSMLPIAAKVEVRKEGKMGRVYYPAPYMDDTNMDYYVDAYELGADAIIDTYAAAAPHVDQGMSMTLFFKGDATTRDINKAQIKAWKSGCKTVYYIRVRQDALPGTEVEGCVSCSV